MNTRVWPFNVLSARRALNYAIDRSKLIQLIGGPLVAQPTCQILPPALPGYRPYCPYTLSPNSAGVWTAPDLARAQELVIDSGTRGARVTVAQHEPVHADILRLADAMVLISSPA